MAYLHYFNEAIKLLYAIHLSISLVYTNLF